MIEGERYIVRVESAGGLLLETFSGRAHTEPARELALRIAAYRPSGTVVRIQVGKAKYRYVVGRVAGLPSVTAAGRKDPRRHARRDPAYASRTHLRGVRTGYSLPGYEAAVRKFLRDRGEHAPRRWFRSFVLENWHKGRSPEFCGQAVSLRMLSRRRR
jgi:hypothetical protein